MRILEKAGRAIAIVGLQFGSEGKGAIAAYLSAAASVCVRIGAANAGHTVMYNGVPYVMRTIPCGWVNPLTKLVIGISSIISLPVLLKEITLIEKIEPIRHRLFIDAHAHVITDAQIRDEQATTLAERISSTSAKSGLGIGMAMSDKVMRSDRCTFAKDIPVLRPFIVDTVELLNRELDSDQLIIFEGTQGFGLSLEHGNFPYVTSRDTTAQALFSGCGVNPYGFDVEVIGVARTYPIRVGGPSGSFGTGSQEISWDAVARRAGNVHDITERTSVTGSVRRVATFSYENVRRACMVNRVSEIALTFLDHLDAQLYNKEMLSPSALEFIHELEEKVGVPVGLAKTGPLMTIDFNAYRANMMRRLA
ncbi:MAG TPA: adenylosuccinate synthetase [Candidatus Paceibacterota bacterium]|nr:adenylosuccinate synthetase [Candidatus Paceibacterota bacterium]